jgi:hypothetical protein
MTDVGQLLINEWEKLDSETSPGAEEVKDPIHEGTGNGEKAADAPAAGGGEPEGGVKGKGGGKGGGGGGGGGSGKEGGGP